MGENKPIRVHRVRPTHAQHAHAHQYTQAQANKSTHTHTHTSVGVSDGLGTADAARPDSHRGMRALEARTPRDLVTRLAKLPSRPLSPSSMKGRIVCTSLRGG